MSSIRPGFSDSQQEISRFSIGFHANIDLWNFRKPELSS
jgi:hypothetical protein